MDWTGLIYSGSSPPLSFPGLIHIFFQTDLAGGQQFEQSNIVQQVHTLQRLINENAKFLSGNIPAIFLFLDTPGTVVLHSKYIRRTFYVFQLHFVSILGRSKRIRQPFREHSDFIRTASRHIATRLQALFGQQSNCTHMVFEVHSGLYDSILNILTVFQLHLSCILELIQSGICKNH